MPGRSGESIGRGRSHTGGGHGPERHPPLPERRDERDEQGREGEIGTEPLRIAENGADHGPERRVDQPACHEGNDHREPVGRRQAVRTGALLGQRPVLVGHVVEAEEFLPAAEALQLRSERRAHQHMARIDEQRREHQRSDRRRARPELDRSELRPAGEDHDAHQEDLERRKPLAGGNRPEQQADRGRRYRSRPDIAQAAPDVVAHRGHGFGSLEGPAQPACAARKAPGVTPKRALKARVRCGWSQKPVAAATSPGISPRRSRSRARRTRTSTR